MTRNTCARIAGVAYLTYIAAGLTQQAVMHGARSGADDAARIASVAAHAMDVRVGILLALVECFCALVLAVTVYGITREQNHEVATFGLVCRVAEGVIGAAAIESNAQMLWLATGGAAGRAYDAATLGALRAFVLMPGSSVPGGAVFFAVGSTAFCWLLLRGRMVPAAIAWLGVLSSALLAVALPLQMAGISTGPVSGLAQWMPALVFELSLAGYFLVKGVRAPAGRAAVAAA